MDYVGLFDASPNPYLVLDRSLNIAGANAAYLASVRRDLSDILGRWAWDAFPTDPETERQAIASFERVIDTKQPDTMALLRFDVPRPESQGGGFEKRFWSIIHSPVLDAEGEVALVLQHPIDITELETLRANLRLDEAEEDIRLTSAQSGMFERARSVSEQNLTLQGDRARLKRMFAKAPSFMALLEGPEHVFQLVNEAYTRIIGHRDVVGRSVVAAMPDAAAQGYVELLDEVYRTNQAHVARGASFAVQAIPGGPIDQRFIDFIYQPVCDDHGHCHGIFVEGYDVTERVEAEERQRRLVVRDRFLLDLETKLRPIADASDILLMAAKALGDFLEADQVAYSDIDPTVHSGIIEHEWNGGSIPSNRGLHLIDDFGEGFAADLRAGRVIVVEDVTTDSRTSSPEALASFERVHIRALINLPIVKDDRLTALFNVHAATPRAWTEEEVALALDVTERVWASVVRTRAEAELRQSEAYIRLLMESTAEGFYSVDRDGVTTLANAAFLRMMGFGSLEDVVGRKLHSVIHHSHPDGTHYHSSGCPVYQCAQHGTPAHVTGESFYRTDGTPVPVEYWVHPILIDGNLQGAVCSFLDVTARREMERQRAELSEEMVHRMKNTLAMVQSIARQTFRTADSMEDAEEAISGRIAALARAQDILTQSQWDAAPVVDVVTTALAPHRDASGERFSVTGPNVQLSSQQALGLSLALHELATNAAKYGSLSNATGTVLISWTVDDGGAFAFEWREMGGPLVAERTRVGFGSRLIERLVATYFRGKTELVFKPSGVHFCLAGRIEQAGAASGH